MPKVNWSNFANNIKSAQTSSTASLGNTSTNLAPYGAVVNFTLASSGVAFVTVNTAIISSTDFEHKPQIYLDGTLMSAPGYPAQTGSASRSQPRSYSAAIPLTSGSHTLSCGVSLSSSTGAQCGATCANITAIVLGNVTN